MFIEVTNIVKHIAEKLHGEGPEVGKVYFIKVLRKNGSLILEKYFIYEKESEDRYCFIEVITMENYFGLKCEFEFINGNFKQKFLFD